MPCLRCFHHEWEQGVKQNINVLTVFKVKVMMGTIFLAGRQNFANTVRRVSKLDLTLYLILNLAPSKMVESRAAQNSMMNKNMIII